MKIGEWDIKVYCQKHQIQGKKKIQKMKQMQDAPSISADIIMSDEEALDHFKMETRLLKEKKQFAQKREQAMSHVNIDRVLNDDKSLTFMDSIT